MKSLRSLARAASALALLAGSLVAQSAAPATAKTVTAAATATATTATSAATSAAATAAEARGFVDAHSHLFSYEAFGGMLICGKPFDPDGIAAALRDCPDHYPNGELAWFENFTRTGSPTGTHDPTGWPTFPDWPAHDSLTHQQAYYTWVERAWRGGLRVLVNHLVANRQLCAIYPLRRHGCDEMDSIRLQAQRARQLQDHIDAEHGGPGRGWFRIVEDTAQARQVIEAGKLAVVLGVETSEPFGCRQILGISRCTRAQIDRGLDEMYALGVRSMFVCHKYDNALCGVRFDSGTQGVIVNVGNLLGTGSFWQARTCTTAEHDNTIDPAGVLPDQIARLLPPGVSLPAYPPAPHCNTRGLTALGQHMVEGMMRRGMMIEVDHMSVKAADRTLDLLEAAGYPGVISSHSWTDPRYLERIYALGGMVAQYGHDAEHFVDEWRRTEPLRDAHQVPGYGYGLDANGIGQLPGPRSGNAGNPVTYPFTSLNGVTLDRQQTGQRVWDVNVDGVANYGLVPDWIEDMRIIAGPEIVEDMAAGAESYLRTWESAAQHAATR
ncbi:Coagulation factor 5/8 type domain-containing protein [Nonomuraea sp. CA-218870]|uniref:Coagulation factor 5/8 type domain-containing protein n=1 Tax=Nonomuraea sp. CA-218870 TaxID=3239998 RepID=UPI003D8E7796